MPSETIHFLNLAVRDRFLSVDWRQGPERYRKKRLGFDGAVRNCGSFGWFWELEVVKTSLKNVTIRVTASLEERDPEVGGIPVDSEYVIFIVDTSGSMNEICDQVIDVINRVLDIHPKVSGIQVMNDNGIYLIDSTRRKWIPDTSRSRESVKRLLELWTSFSNSSPVEGLEIAL